MGENVRFLMPAPYNQQHDHFLKRHLACGATNVIGTNRAVPILRADGTQSIVHLSVQECVDPGSSSNRLFVGVMKFAVTDGLMETFRNTIKHNETGLLEVPGCPYPCRAVLRLSFSCPGPGGYSRLTCQLSSVCRRPLREPPSLLRKHGLVQARRTRLFLLTSLTAVVVVENEREHNHVPVLFRKQALGRAGEEVPALHRE